MRRVAEIIAAKRDGERLPDDELRELLARYAKGDVPDYQMAALAMAVYFRGLDVGETRTWTEAMMRSGEVLDLAALGPGRVDKHSTGGVGDKISLPLAPAAAACGVEVPMISGRSLGHTGGTLDKLESIPGYRADLTAEAFQRVVGEVGCSIIGQTGELAPADKRLYALRDVTGTVESMEMITASIMSKKLAEDLEGLVLDVKVGRGAFMKTVADARALAERMVEVGRAMGTRVVAQLSRMEEPIGRMVGNACEVREAVQVLRGEGPADVVALVEALGGAMVEMARGVAPDEGRAAIREALTSGAALDRWERMVRLHGGDPDRVPDAPDGTPVPAPHDGWVTAIDGFAVGQLCARLGAGRSRPEDRVDPLAGLRIDALRGTRVTQGEPLATLFHGEQGAPSEARLEEARAAFTLGGEAPEAEPLLLDRIG